MNENIKRLNKMRSDKSYRLPFKTHVWDLTNCIHLLVKSSIIFSGKNNLKRFVIFGQGRSGSTLLASLLDSHPKVNCQDELICRRRLFPLSYIEHRASRSPDGTLAFGFHLKPWHMTRILRIEPLNFVRSLECKGYRFIYLTRENIFLKSLSQVKYVIHRIMHAKKTAEVPTESVSVDTEMLIMLMKEKKALKQLEKNCLNILEKPYITVSYESDLLNSDIHQQTCDRIFDFIGVERVVVNTPHKKVSPPDWREGVRNAKEIESALINEGFERFIQKVIKKN